MARKRSNKGVGGMVALITLAYFGWKFFFKKPAAALPAAAPSAISKTPTFEPIESWEV